MPLGKRESVKSVFEELVVLLVPASALVYSGSFVLWGSARQGLQPAPCFVVTALDGRGPIAAASWLGHLASVLKRLLHPHHQRDELVRRRRQPISL